MNARLAVLGVDGQKNSAGISFVANGVTFKTDERGVVPVWLEAREMYQRDIYHLLGSAKLSVHDGVLWADCELLDIRLPGSLMNILYPHACGEVVRNIGPVVHEMVIDGINISSDTPLDTRVGTLHSQGVKATVKG